MGPSDVSHLMGPDAMSRASVGAHRGLNPQNTAHTMAPAASHPGSQTLSGTSLPAPSGSHQGDTLDSADRAVHLTSLQASAETVGVINTNGSSYRAKNGVFAVSQMKSPRADARNLLPKTHFQPHVYLRDGKRDINNLGQLEPVIKRRG